MGGKDLGKDKKKPISRSARAGLQFPVGRIHRLLKASQAWLACCCYQPNSGCWHVRRGSDPWLCL